MAGKEPAQAWQRRICGTLRVIASVVVRLAITASVNGCCRQPCRLVHCSVLHGWFTSKPMHGTSGMHILCVTA